ncbi:sensor domain-containing diguanylate cyclase [Sedimentibacter sp. zth1]|uniref:sensor domain-containing diguanylate cyclase n=1 Tax=Sedimentibacter sp. zth1 TaxID=2816908 RepID=UPI001A936F88|nr:sensor domain-containing diguanylate cyclase [Sedimentibacter sp. zth1]QSX05134.1 sensor domain-containing diguanylate cyclase [Sedimentibacter sp. zth1]
MNNKTLVITGEDFKTFNNLILAPIIIFNKEKILFANKIFISTYSCFKNISELYIDELFNDEILMEQIKNLFDKNKNFSKNEVSIRNNKGKLLYANVLIKPVIFNDKNCLLMQFADVTENVITKNQLISMTNVRNLMLKITENIVKFNDINDIYNLTLETALKTFNNNCIGTIMIKKDSEFEVVAHIGYEEKIKKFSIKQEETFLYRSTNGKMNDVKNISDLSKIVDFYPIETCYGRKQYIKSSLISPIIIKDNIYGMICIDSVKINSFDKDDVRLMKFLKSSIEIAISNYLLYSDQIFYANHDYLTKLYNRMFLEKQFNVLKSNAVLYNKTLNLVLIDVNHLKIINDKYGHLCGDNVLKHVADKFFSISDKNDVVARIGGDEFVSVYYDKSINNIKDSLDNILSEMKEEYISMSNCSITCSFCYGIATFRDDGMEFKELLKRADIEMYKAKVMLK